MTQTVYLHEQAISVAGQMPAVGSAAPGFSLTDKTLSQKTLADYAGKRKVLNIFPSVDTGTCAASVRVFNQKASELANTVVLCISADLPFAQARFCGAEGLDNVVTLSTFRSAFLTDYSVGITDGAMAGLTARAVLVLDENNVIVHQQLVSNLANEPDYAAVMAVLG